MKKSICILFLFSFRSISLFSIETVITPTISYSNYFLRTVYTNRKTNTYLHTVSLGLDLVFIGEETAFTFFANNHISFMEETQVFGDVDFVSGKGASVVEGMIWDSSLLAGYTIDPMEDLKLRLGVGLGIFHGFQPKSKSIETAMGSIFAFYIDYFFIHGLGLSFGIENGVYGSIRKRQNDEKRNFFNRVQTKIGLAIRF
jgi:hypothetical protein